LFVRLLRFEVLPIERNRDKIVFGADSELFVVGVEDSTVFGEPGPTEEQVVTRLFNNFGGDWKLNTVDFQRKVANNAKRVVRFTGEQFKDAVAGVVDVASEDA